MSKKSSNGSADGERRRVSSGEGRRSACQRGGASPSITDSSDLNDSFLRQLKLMKERVSLLDGDVTTSGSRGRSSGDSECSTLRSVSNIQTYENVSYAKELDLDNYQLVTPRTLEVPPKRPCFRSPSPHLKRSIWTEKHLEAPSEEPAQLPLEPSVIVVKNDSNESKSSTSVESLSNVTTITYPSCKISSASTEIKDADILNKYYESAPKVCTSTITVATLFNTKNFSNGIKKIFNKSKSKSKSSVSSARDEEDLAYLSDEQVIRTINYSDYNLPISQLTVLPDVKNSKEIINTLANKVFKSKETIQPSSLGLSSPTTSISPHKSYKNLVRRPNNYVEENIGDGCANFRAATAIFQRRPQILDLAYYDVDLARQGASGDTQVEQPEIMDAHYDSASETTEAESSPTSCCHIRLIAEFLFPKREKRYFY